MGLDAKTQRQKYEQICEVKARTSFEKLCAGFPDEFVDYFHAVRQLRFQEEPDYTSYRRMFRTLLLSLGFVYDSVYDWTRGSPARTARPAKLPEDFCDRVKKPVKMSPQKDHSHSRHEREAKRRGETPMPSVPRPIRVVAAVTDVEVHRRFPVIAPSESSLSSDPRRRRPLAAIGPAPRHTRRSDYDYDDFVELRQADTWREEAPRRQKKQPDVSDSFKSARARIGTTGPAKPRAYLTPRCTGAKRRSLTPKMMLPGWMMGALASGPGSRRV
jgi:hypothetical protein